MTTKTIAEKLIIKPNTTVWSLPASHLDRIGQLPTGVEVAADLDDATTALIFAADEGTLRDMLAAHGDRLSRHPTVWVAYPKGNKADINRDSVWPILAQQGMRPIGQVAIDDVWSALRFRPNKEGEDIFTGGGNERSRVGAEAS